MLIAWQIFLQLLTVGTKRSWTHLQSMEKLNSLDCLIVEDDEIKLPSLSLCNYLHFKLTEIVFFPFFNLKTGQLEF